MNSSSPIVEINGFHLSYQFTTSVFNNTGSDNYTLDIHADITGLLDFPGPPSVCKEIPLGKLHLYRVQLGNATNDRISRLDVFDERQETMDVGEALFDPSFDEFKPSVQKMFPDAGEWNDILIINRLELFPFARGCGIGAAVIHQAMQDFGGGCSIVILKAFPLQIELNAETKPYWKELQLEAFPQNERQATEKLKAYYSRLGFEQIGKTPYFATSMEYTIIKKNLPPLKPICAPASLFSSEPGSVA